MDQKEKLYFFFFTFRLIFIIHTEKVWTRTWFLDILLTFIFNYYTMDAREKDPKHNMISGYRIEEYFKLVLQIIFFIKNVYHLPRAGFDPTTFGLPDPHFLFIQKKNHFFKLNYLLI